MLDCKQDGKRVKINDIYFKYILNNFLSFKIRLFLPFNIAI